MFLFKKRKKESVAIPFLISMIVTLLVIGIPVFNFYNHLINNKKSNESNYAARAFEPSEKNDTTLLFSFDADDPSLRDSFVILRTSAINKSFVFIPVSNDILSGNKKMSDVYNKGGIMDLKKAVESTFDIKIDRYMEFNDKSFSFVCDTIGGVNYTVPDGLKGLNEGTQYLSSEFIIKLISNKNLSEDARTVMIGSVLSEMISQASGTRIADTFDYSYNQVIDIVETDITSIDYDNQKKAIEYIFRSNQFKSTYRIPTCESTEEGLKLDSKSFADIKSELGI